MKKLKKAILPGNYENYVFDLYGTLVDIATDEANPKLWKRMAMLFGYYGADYTEKELQKRYELLVALEESRLRDELEEDPEYIDESFAEIDILKVFRTMLTDRNPQADEEMVRSIAHCFRLLSTKKLQLYPGTLELLISLKDAGKKVYLLSNAQHEFTMGELRLLKLENCFDRILLSSDYGYRKPDRRYFMALLEEERLDPAKCLYVGNDALNDVHGAKKMGMDAYYIQTAQTPKGDNTKEADYMVKKFEKWEGLEA